MFYLIKTTFCLHKMNSSPIETIIRMEMHDILFISVNDMNLFFFITDLE